MLLLGFCRRDLVGRKFLRHIEWSQKRYREMLGDTFELAEAKVRIVAGQKPLDFYRAPPERGAPDIVSELLTHFQLILFNFFSTRCETSARGGPCVIVASC